jgi:DNA primase
MASLIPQSFIDDLLERTDLVELVDNSVKLKKTGRNYTGLCPFHSEKSPSFSVVPDKQFYHCFGCGASGNAIKFLMEHERLDFVEAVEDLAGRCGVEVPKEASTDDSPQRKSLYDLLQASNEFFQQQLRKHEQKSRAIDYLQNRGLSGKAALFFNIGYAPPGWNNLQDSLGRDEKIQKDLIQAGMLIENEKGRVYDRFRDRIMFPIRDARGRVIAYGGRVLGDEKPKYLNSPETPVFHKSNELYGLYEAKKIRQKLTRFLVVEGYMDVVALAEYGIHFAVATLGTATSSEHLEKLFKVVPEVICCFDGDKAGRQAAQRAMETALPALRDGLQVRFLFLPDGEDPDTLVRKEGKEAFIQRVNNATPLPDYFFEQLAKDINIEAMDGKARLSALAGPKIEQLADGVLKELMLAKLSDLTGLNRERLQASTAASAQQNPKSRLSTSNVSPARTRPTHTPIQPIANTQIPHTESRNNSDVSHYADSYDTHSHFDEYDTQHNYESPHQPQQQEEQHDYKVAEYSRRALSLLCRSPALANENPLPSCLSQFSDEYSALLIQLIAELRQSPQSNPSGLILQWANTPQYQQIHNILETKDFIEPDDGLEAEFQGVLKLLSNHVKRLELQSELNQLKQIPNAQLSTEQKQRLMKLIIEIQSLNHIPD